MVQHRLTRVVALGASAFLALSACAQGTGSQVEGPDVDFDPGAELSGTST